MDDSQKLIVCVCTANICRSPMAEALLRHALAAEPEPLKSYQVVSAGVSAWNGERVSTNSLRALKPVGLDLSKHQSQILTEELLNKADLILCMTSSHREYAEQMFPNASTPIYLFREFMGEGYDPEIPDPYGMSLPAYEASRDSMVEAIPSILQYLREQASKDS